VKNQISEKLFNDIQKYIEKYNPKIDFDYNNSLDKNQINQILENGIDNFYNDLYENNLDCIFETEDYFIKSIANDYFEELTEELNIDSDYNFESEKESIINDNLVEFIKDNFSEFIHVDLNRNQFLNQDVLCHVTVYSNYDCTNTTNEIDESENYLSEIWKSVAIKGIKKQDYLSEFYNTGTACLLTFLFETSLNDLIKLRENFKNSIVIPKGTTFGFFGTFYGNGSQFSHKTYKTIKLNKIYGETKYDSISIHFDGELSYNIQDVYGCNLSTCNDNIFVS